MAPINPADDAGRASGPANAAGQAERRSPAGSPHSNGQPRIDLAEALRNNWLEIWLQPKIDLKRKCLAGAEATTRIRHPDFGMLLPGYFLPNASQEDTLRLAEHAILATLRNWSAFDSAGFNLHLAVNAPVSVLLKLPIAELLRENRPKAEHWPGIILEVSEDQIVRDIKQVHDIATELRVSGVAIAIDEFGAGFSSFSSLRNLPFAELKLDSGFVKNCATDATGAAICQTAIDLAHRFGSAAVAAGIDDQVDLQALVVMGCDFGQGPLIAPAMPPERFLALLQQRAQQPAAQSAPRGPAPIVAGFGA